VQVRPHGEYHRIIVYEPAEPCAPASWALAEISLKKIYSARLLMFPRRRTGPARHNA